MLYIFSFFFRVAQQTCCSTQFAKLLEKSFFRVSVGQENLLEKENWGGVEGIKLLVANN